MMKMTKKKVTILLKEMVDALASMAKAKSLSLSLQTRISALKLRLMLFSLLRDRRFQVGTIPNNLHRRRRHHHNNKLEQQQQQQQQMVPIRDDEPQFHRGDEGDKRVVLFYYDDGDCSKSEASVVVNCDGDGGKSEASVNCEDDGGEFDAGGSDVAEAEANRGDTEAEEEEVEVNPVSEEWLEGAAVATATAALEEEDGEKVLDELEFVVEGGGDSHKVLDEVKLVVDGDNPASKSAALHEIDGGGGAGGGWWQKSAVKKEEEEEEGFELEDKIDEVADLFIKRFHEQMRMERSPIHQ